MTRETRFVIEEYAYLMDPQEFRNCKFIYGSISDETYVAVDEPNLEEAYMLAKRGQQCLWKCNNCEGLALIREAIELGYDRAHRHLGIAYFYGIECEMDIAEAVTHWKMAAEAGDNVSEVMMCVTMFDCCSIMGDSEQEGDWRETVVNGLLKHKQHSHLAEKYYGICMYWKYFDCKNDIFFLRARDSLTKSSLRGDPLAMAFIEYLYDLYAQEHHFTRGESKRSLEYAIFYWRNEFRNVMEKFRKEV